MKYLKSASVAAAGGVLMTALAAAPASAAAAPAEPRLQAAANLNWGALHPAPFAKSEADNVYQATKTGKIKLVLLYRHGKGSLGLRLVTCKGKKGLTGWKQMKKTKTAYTLDKKVKKGTCFRVQSGRSWVNSATGYVSGSVKWLKTP